MLAAQGCSAMRTPLAPLLALAAAALAVPAAIPAQETAPDEGQATTPAEQQQTVPAQTQTTPAPAVPPPAAATQPAPPPPKPAPPQELVDPAAKPAPVARAAAPGSVTIKDFSFGPKSVTVNVGESVTWVNSGPTGHSATASDGTFDTGVMGKGESGSHRFTEAGTFAYICTPHPGMKGTVRVVGSSAGGEDSSAGGGSTSSDGGTAPASGAAAAEADDGPSLPASGAEAGLLAGAGVLFLALGAAMRRRATREEA